MRRRPLFWLAVSVVCILGAFYFWRLGDEWNARQGKTRPEAPSPESASTNAASAAARSPSIFEPRETVVPASTAPLAPASLLSTNATERPTIAQLRQKYRVSNTSASLHDLARSDHAILLANALIDVSRPLDLAIPDSLRAQGDP